MKVFVTGAGGFIGSSLVRELLSQGVEVAVLKRRHSNPTRLDWSSEVTTIFCEDTSQLLSHEVITQLKKFAPDSIVHLGWAGVGNSDRNSPLQLTNLQIISDLIELGGKVGVLHFVGLGSQAEYGPCEGAIDESQALNPKTLYGAAKASSFLIANVKCGILGMGFSWVRVFSTYGPGDEPYWMIQDVASQLIKGVVPQLTLGTQRWDYLYIDDAAKAIAAVAVSVDGLGVLNLGSGSSQTIREIVEEIRDAVGVDTPLNFGGVAFRQDQVMHLQADVTKLRRLTGWEPKVPLKLGIARTIAALKQGTP